MENKAEDIGLVTCPIDWQKPYIVVLAVPGGLRAVCKSG